MSSKPLILASAVIVLATITAAAIFVLNQSNKTSTAKKETSNASSDAVAKKETEVGKPPKIAKAVLIEIINQITLQMEKIILRISQLEQSVTQQAKEEGQQIDVEEFKQHMMNEFKSAVKEAEARVYAHYKVSENEVEEAAEYFDDDADFQVAIRTMKRKYALFTSEGGSFLFSFYIY
jgi:hypothetical protein